ncbi:MAG: hypothetical protein K9M15_00595 [Candidatus Marinimicrobia bacterium]|nr:hypothetical protein [Candidatus Neomarinimicrobiota bacterium]
MGKRQSLICLVLVYVLAIALNGCVGLAVPLVQATHAAFAAHKALTITKIVQSSTAGSTEITLGENEISSQDQHFARISKLAVWPGEGMVSAADKLQQSHAFALVVTPSKVGKVIDGADSDQQIRNLTQMEKKEACRLVCEKTKTDAVVVFENLGVVGNSGQWSFRRSSVGFKGKVSIYSAKLNDFIYVSAVDMKMSLGSNTPNAQNMMREAGQQIAQKIIEMKQRQMTTAISVSKKGG